MIKFKLESGLEAFIIWQPPFDLRNDPKGNFGIGAVRMFLGVRAKPGAYVFNCQLPIYLPNLYESNLAHEVNWHAKHPTLGPLSWKVDGWGVDYHASSQIEPYLPAMENCHMLYGATCYMDGSSLRGKEWGERMTVEWIDWIFTALEELWKERFGGIPKDNP